MSGATANEPAVLRHRSRGIELNVLQWGHPEAPPLVMIHGGLENAEAWRPMADRLALRWRVIAPDLRGHGDSGWAPGCDYAILDFVGDIAALFHHLGLTSAVLVGHSLGGAVATGFAALYPDRITRLCVVEGMRPANQAAPATLDETFAAIRNWTDKGAVAAPQPQRYYPDLDSMVARLCEADPLMPPALARELVGKSVREYEGGLRWKYDPRIREMDLLSVIGPEPRHFWERIACPTLLVYGAQSWATNPAKDGRLAHFRNARVEEVSAAGHNVHHHQPEAFLKLLEGFLGER